MPTPWFPTNPIPEHRRLVGLDTETFLIQVGRQAPKLVCVSTCEQGESPRLYDHVEGMNVFRQKLSDESVVLVIANAPFDLAVTCSEDPTLIPLVMAALLQERIFDPLLWQRLYNIRHGNSEYDPFLHLKISDGYYSLETMAKRWLGESISGKHGPDVWRTRYHELFGTPIEQWPEDAKAYAAKDAWYHLRVAECQLALDGVQPDFWRKMRQNFSLYLKTCRGLRTQTEVVREVEADIHEHVDEKLLELLDEGIYKIGGTKKAPKLEMDTKEVRRLVEEAFVSQGLQVPRTDPRKMTEANQKKHPNGQVKYDDETLENSKHPFLCTLADIGADKKLLSTYIPALLRGTIYPLNPRYTVPVDSGRSSSSRINIQNQPRRGGIRECFVPRVGYIFLDCDYNIAELRSLAQVLINMYGYSTLADAIRLGDQKGKGYDVHCFMAAAILGMELDEFARQFLHGTREEKKKCKQARQTAKILNFGAPGGLGAETFIEYAWTNSNHEIDLDLEKSEYLLNLWKSTFPEMEQYFTDIGSLGGYGGKIAIIQYGSGRLRGGMKFCAACNSNFQGLTADGALEADWRITVECYTGVNYTTDAEVLDALLDYAHYCQEWELSDLYGSYPVWFIHDEEGLESPFDKARAAAKRTSEIMCRTMEEYTPDVPAVAEPDLRRRWYKEAEAVYDDDGELIPWCPPNPRDILRQRKVDGPLCEGLSAWSPEELEQVEQLFPEQSKDWRALNRSWRWELLARQRNPDPWCSL